MPRRWYDDLDYWFRLAVLSVAVAVLVLVMFLLPWCIDEACRSIRGERTHGRP